MESNTRKLFVIGGVMLLVAIGAGLAIYFFTYAKSGIGVWYVTAESTADAEPFFMTVEMPHRGAGKQQLRDYIAKIAANNKTQPANEPVEIGRVYYSATKGAPSTGFAWVILLNPASERHKYVLAKELTPRGELRPLVGAPDVSNLQNLLVENFYSDMDVAERERIHAATKRR